MESKNIYDIIITPNSIIRASIHEYKVKEVTKKYFSFRFWNKQVSGNFLPSKIGISIEFQYFGEFEKAFKALRQELIDNHLEELDKI